MVCAANIAGAVLCSGELASHLGLDWHVHIHNALYDDRRIAQGVNQWMWQGHQSCPCFTQKALFISYYCHYHEI